MEGTKWPGETSLVRPLFDKRSQHACAFLLHRCKTINFEGKYLSCQDVCEYLSCRGTCRPLTSLWRVSHVMSGNIVSGHHLERSARQNQQLSKKEIDVRVIFRPTGAAGTSVQCRRIQHLASLSRNPFAPVKTDHEVTASSAGPYIPRWKHIFT